MPIAALLVSLLVVLWVGQRWLIYFPERLLPPLQRAGLPSAEPVAFETEDELHLEGWFVRPTVAPSGQTVIVFNGNAGNRAHRAPLAAALASAATIVSP